MKKWIAHLYLRLVLWRNERQTVITERVEDPNPTAMHWDFELDNPVQSKTFLYRPKVVYLKGWTFRDSIVRFVGRFVS